MPRNVYSEINLHFVWHTKESRRLIRPETERTIHDFIWNRARAADGVFVHEIGGTTNHVHIAARVPPTIQITGWIGQVKGGSSHDANELPVFSGSFEWQTGYGVVSFGSKDLAWVVSYIRNQKRHHDENTWQERLERITRIAREG